MFIELLVAGLGGLVWFSFIVIIVFGPEPIVYLIQSTELNDALVSFVALGAAYVLGIILDRAFEPIWSRPDRIVREKLGLSLDDYYKAQVTLAASGNDRLNDLLGFYTSRMRILRASMVNFFLCAIFGLWAFWPYKITPWFIFIASSIAVILAYFALRELSKKYYKKVIEAQFAAGGP